MKRRDFITLFSSTAVWPFPAAAQTSPRIPRVGFLGAGSPTLSGRNLDALRQGLRALGHVEGQTIALEIRWAEGRPERMSELAVELLRLGIDVLVVGTSQAALAAKKATQTTPIVLVAGADPVGMGLVASLSHPGGNVTGLSLSNEELSSKRVQLLKEFVPVLARVAVLKNPLLTGHTTFFWQDTEAAARKLGLELQPLEVRGVDDLELAFAAARLGNAQALIAFDDIIPYRPRVIALAADHRIPAMYGFRDFPDNGGLMSYGANIPALFRRAATFVDRILKGAKPADLPVELPTKFEFVVNLKTAKALGLAIPPAILASADDVIE
jgi:putative tryptophan/tyrosine transport system substrate-binding protein